VLVLTTDISKAKCKIFSQSRKYFGKSLHKSIGGGDGRDDDDDDDDDGDDNDNNNILATTIYRICKET